MKFNSEPNRKYMHCPNAQCALPQFWALMRLNLGSRNPTLLSGSVEWRFPRKSFTSMVRSRFRHLAIDSCTKSLGRSSQSSGCLPGALLKFLLKTFQS